MADRFVRIEGVEDTKDLFRDLIRSMSVNQGVRKSLDAGGNLTASFSRDEAPVDTGTLSKSQGMRWLGFSRRVVSAIRPIRNPRSGKRASQYQRYVHEDNPYYDRVIAQRSRVILNLMENTLLNEVDL
jgi:hypothetical protein